MNFSKKKVIEKNKAIISTPRKLTTKMLVTIFKVCIYFLVLGIATIGFFGLGTLKGIIDGAPSVETINISPVEFSTAIYDSDGNEIEKLITDGSNRQKVSINDIPNHLKYAFIDIEDERFESHNGVDVIGIIRAGVSILSGERL